MSEQVQEVAELAAKSEAPQAEPQKKQITFAEYKRRLKEDVEIAELRSRLAEATFRELAAANQYNQLRAALENAMKQPEASDDETSDSGATESPEVVATAEVEG